jgi:hypothetical protein
VFLIELKRHLLGTIKTPSGGNNNKEPSGGNNKNAI